MKIFFTPSPKNRFSLAFKVRVLALLLTGALFSCGPVSAQSSSTTVSWSDGTESGWTLYSGPSSSPSPSTFVNDGSGPSPYGIIGNTGSNNGTPAPDLVLKNSAPPTGNGKNGVVWSPAIVLTIPAGETINLSDITISYQLDQYDKNTLPIVGYFSATLATSGTLEGFGDWWDITNDNPTENGTGWQGFPPNDNPTLFWLNNSNSNPGGDNAWATRTKSSNLSDLTGETTESTGDFGVAIASLLNNSSNNTSSKTVYLYLGVANASDNDGSIGAEIDNLSLTVTTITGGVSLPVAVAQPLTASVQGSTIVLNWSTATEINNKEFTIERSADGKTFTNIGFVASQAANGNSTKTLSYTYTDLSPLAGTNYYQLIQTDLDGHTTPSGIVSIDFSGAHGELSVYPNPAHGSVTIAGLQPGSSVSIYDAGGRLVKTFTANAASQQVDINGLAAGVYFVKAAGGLSGTFIVK